MDEQVTLPEQTVSAPAAAPPATPLPPQRPADIMPPAQRTDAPDLAQDQQGPPAPVGPEEPKPVPMPTGKAPPVIAQGPSGSVPNTTPQHAADIMPPSMPSERTVAPQAPITNGVWEPELERSAATTGVSANLMRHIVQVESQGKVNARAGTSSAAGIFQFTGDTWDDVRARYNTLNLTDRMDPVQQARVAPYYMKEIQQHLTRALGHAPSDGESYLGWVFGPKGASLALQANPDTPVRMVMDPKQIAANPGIFKDVQTVRDLYRWADAKMGGNADHPQPAVDLSAYLDLGSHSRQQGSQAVDGLQWELKSGLANMIHDMPPELQRQIKINSGFRSPEQQATIMSEKIGGMLGAQKRAAWDADVAKMGPEAAGQKWHDELRANGITRWVGLPGGSHHQHGQAVDLGFGNDAVKQWVHANAAKYGLGFPMDHEPWHIEALHPMAARQAQQGVSPSYNYGGRPVPFTRADDVAAARQREDNAYSLVKAVGASAQQDWTISNILAGQGKQPYDPAFSVTKDMLQDPEIKRLPENYLRGIADSKSQQDFDFQKKRALADFEREARLAATPYGGLIRMATGLADPGGIVLSAIAPVGLAAKAAGVGRAGMLAATAADGAIGGLASEVPAMLNKPGYEAESAMWAAGLGSASWIALNRHAWLNHPAAPEIQQAVNGMTKMKDELASGTILQNGSVGAATVDGIRQQVREDIEGAVDLTTNKSGAKWMDKLRFDFAKLKNSDNKLVAAIADRMGQDTIGNLDKDKAITRPIEYDARVMEERANIIWSRNYNEAAADYRKRNNISWKEWQMGGEEEFQQLGSKAVRNTDAVTRFDPAVEKIAGTWKGLAEYWRDRARNPGKDRGETLRPLPGAEDWSDAPNYLPRYTNWDKFNQLNGEFGDKLKDLFGNAIHRLNPDLDEEFAGKLGEFYYNRLARVEAGQEISVQKALSGADTEALKSQLQAAGFDRESIEKALFKVEEGSSDGKGLTSRQKRRTLMDENFSMPLSGRNGARDVAVHEIWEDNLRSITHAYNKQMSGAVALAQLRIENPKWKTRVEKVDPVTKAPTGEYEMKETGPQWIVDGIHSDGDWQKLIAQVRAHDNDIRYSDKLRTVDGEIKQLQWIYDTLRGVPSDTDRSKLGQFLRVVHNFNFVRLMSQAGWASVAEFGNLLGNVGLKHMMTTMPSLKELFHDIYHGKLDNEELLHLERTFTSGTDHLRGSGMTWTGTDHATNLNDGAKLSRGLDIAEKVTKKAARYTSMVSLAPLTTFQERWALQAALSKFKAAAKNGEHLNSQRMRLLGLDQEMQDKVLNEIRKHDGTTIIGDRGTPIQTLGLDKWDPQTRSAFEFAMNTWVRRMIQQNDLGQMNAFMGTPLAKIMFQFRNFTIGAWSKQTLSNVHMRDMNTLTSFLASMLFGSIAFGAQRALNAVGLPEKERQKQLEKDLAWDRLVAAGFQRAGHSSLLPGAYDFGAGMLGFDPFFDTRSTQQPTQGWQSNPTTGLIDSIYSGVRQVGKSVHGDDEYTSKNFRDFSRGVNVFHNWPLMIQLINGASGAFPSPTTSH